MKAAVLPVMAALFFCLATPLPGLAESEADRLIGFAGHLFDQGEYYRAVTEYLRFLDYYPDDPRQAEATFMIGRCYLAGERWNEARKWFGRFRNAYPADSRVGETIILEGETFIREERFAEAGRFLRDHGDRLSPAVKERAFRLEIRALVEDGNWPEARARLGGVREDSFLYPGADRLLAGLDDLSEMPHRSPTAAGVMSALLPGVGQLYVGRPKDAFWAFLLNGGFIWAMIQSFETDNTATGVVLAFFEVGWYTGNIYNAVNQAHRFNRRASEKFKRDLLEKTGWVVGLSVNKEKTGLLLTWRW